MIINMYVLDGQYTKKETNAYRFTNKIMMPIFRENYNYKLIQLYWYTTIN